MRLAQRLCRTSSLWRLIAVLALAVMLASLAGESASAQRLGLHDRGRDSSPTRVTTQQSSDGSFQYLVDGRPQTFIGMGYNPIYRHLPDAERAARYDRDFRLLCEAGVNHITGWDADKGYEQDKFDEVTLDYAYKYGIGVVMPFSLPPDADYSDPDYQQQLLTAAAAKVVRFKDHPALRMWGVGNEVLAEMALGDQQDSFLAFYAQLVDQFHRLDPNHPVIYREAEDTFVPQLLGLLGDRPWLLYGTNVYTNELERILDDWPSYGLERPLLVSEFGAEPDEVGGRAWGYVNMWRTIRAHAGYVVGGAPYVWTTEGPEPTDEKWGLVDGTGKPVDSTFEALSAEWRGEDGSQCR